MSHISHGIARTLAVCNVDIHCWMDTKPLEHGAGETGEGAAAIIAAVAGCAADASKAQGCLSQTGWRPVLLWLQ